MSRWLFSSILFLFQRMHENLKDRILLGKARKGWKKDSGRIFMYIFWQNRGFNYGWKENFSTHMYVFAAIFLAFTFFLHYSGIICDNFWFVRSNRNFYFSNIFVPVVTNRISWSQNICWELWKTFHLRIFFPRHKRYLIFFHRVGKNTLKYEYKHKMK